MICVLLRERRDRFDIQIQGRRLQEHGGRHWNYVSISQGTPRTAEASRSWVVVQLLSGVWLFVTPWTAACQASLSFTISQSLLKLMSIESVMPSNHLVICWPLLPPPSIFPTSGSFPMNQLFTSGGQRIGASASVLPVNIQDWFPLGLAGWISLQSKGLSRVFSNTSSKASNSLVLSILHGPTLTSIHDQWNNT